MLPFFWCWNIEQKVMKKTYDVTVVFNINDVMFFASSSILRFLSISLHEHFWNCSKKFIATKMKKTKTGLMEFHFIILMLKKFRVNHKSHRLVKTQRFCDRNIIDSVLFMKLTYCWNSKEWNQITRIRR
jgi:hypothetical protein